MFAKDLFGLPGELLSAEKLEDIARDAIARQAERPRLLKQASASQEVARLRTALSEAIEAAWLEAKTRINEKTRDGYRSLLESRILPTFGVTRLSSIDRTMVGSWVHGMAAEGLSFSRVRQAHQCLAAIMEQALDDGLIGRNPARRVELPDSVNRTTGI